MILVAGATGFLGGEVVRLLRAAGKPVRAMVRATSDEAKKAALEAGGATLVAADLKDRAALEAACRGAEAVISTASSTLSRQEGDSVESVDRDGQLALVDAAAAAGVKHFVFVSFAPVGVDFALQRAKRAVEARVRESGMTYTILQPTDFMEVWLSPAVGFDAANGKARVFGAGDQPRSFVSLGDVARFCVAAIDAPGARNETLTLSGTTTSYREVVSAFEAATGRKVEVEAIPVAALEGQLAAATNSLEEAFGALMLSAARGGVVSCERALAAMPIELTSLDAFVKRSLG